MENKELQFKTNLNCGGCVSKVKADLDNTAGINQWNVNTENPDKILSVSGNDISEETIINIIKSKGFDAEPIKS